MGATRRQFVQGIGAAMGAAAISPPAVAAPPAATHAAEPHEDAGAADRRYWVGVLERLATPVLTALSQRQLRRTMLVESRGRDRQLYTHLEALGRLLAGIAPWLALAVGDDDESQTRRRLLALTHQAIDAATDPRSPDYMNFSEGQQPIVDAAFFAQALLRAPEALFAALDPPVRRNLVAALMATRSRKPAFNNWLLFAATIEAALSRLGETYDPMRVDFALRQHERWYVGDGVYTDGPVFHFDYYNSFVIHPMMLDVLDAVGDHDGYWKQLKRSAETRAARYAAIQERLIAPDGTFPPVGRSLAYRFGVFHLLAQVALRRRLPAALPPAQVRCALTAVIRRMIEAPGTFDAAGWLRIGFAGHQPAIGETYISTGSCYLCATGLLPLGLPAADELWRGRADWTSKRIWAGEDLPADHAL